MTLLFLLELLLLNSHGTVRVVSHLMNLCTNCRDLLLLLMILFLWHSFTSLHNSVTAQDACLEMCPNPRASNLSQILHDFIQKKAEKLTQLQDLDEIDMTRLQFLALHLSCTKYLYRKSTQWNGGQRVCQSALTMDVLSINRPRYSSCSSVKFSRWSANMQKY